MKKNAFTLVELLITLMVATVMLTGLIILINPFLMIQKAYDTSRKANLDDAKKMLEEYENDTGCYPLPTQVCADADSNSITCHVCTNKQAQKFSYFTHDICDPRLGMKGYLYQPETVLRPKDFVHNIPAALVVPSCPKWFRIYSVLDSPYNAAEDVWGCKKGGCGINPTYGYSYLVSSPGAPIDNAVTSNWYCYTNDCVQCSPYENCIDPTNACSGKQLYPNRHTCCVDHDPHSPYCLGN